MVYLVKMQANPRVNMFSDKNLHQHFAALHDQQDHDDNLLLINETNTEIY